MSLARITLIGNIGRDPEASQTTQGVTLTKFSLAVSTGKGDKETTTWYNITSFRGLAETINTHAVKGQQVYVEGTFLPRQYTTKEGKPGTSLDVTCDVFQFLGSKPNGKADAARDFDDVPF